MYKKSLVLTIAIAVNSATAQSNTVNFIDTSFDLAGYSSETFQTGGASINTSQTLTSGNPGAGIQSLINVPSYNGTFYTREYYINSLWSYDPGTQGAINTLDVSTDLYFDFQPGPLQALGVVYLLRQSGNYYIHTTTLPVVNATWQTGSESGLSLNDFGLVSNLLTGTTDFTSNPDSTSGEIELGFLMGTYVTGSSAQSIDYRLDNLSYTVSSVPIPASLWLLSSALVALLGFKRNKIGNS